MMHAALDLSLVFALGFFIGVLFFGGLWWTIQASVLAKYPASLFFASFWIRISLTLGSFYLISHGEGKRFAICLFGFIVARPVFLRLQKSFTLPPLNRSSCPSENHHAY